MISDKTKEKASSDLELDEIIKSIRGIIDDHSQSPSSFQEKDDGISEEDDDSVLELTNIVDSINSTKVNSKEDKLVSSDVQDKVQEEISKFSDSLDISENQKNDESESLDSTVNRLMRPLIKNWLDNNLPNIVEKVISEEIRGMISKRK